MKKNLLFVLAAMLSFSVAAQNRVKNPLHRVSAPSKFVSEPPASKKATTHSSATSQVQRQVPGVNQPNFVSVIPIGNNPNAFSCANASRSNIAYNQDINTVVHIHRGDPAITGDATTGFYRYDMSNDGGNTWTSNNGPIYSDPGGVGARYPVCGIYNPPSNTTPTDAFIAVYGPWTSGSGWGGTVTGVSKFNLSGTLYSNTTDPIMTFPDNMTVVKNTGHAWRIGNSFDVGGQTFNFASNITHGIWNTGTSQYDFVETVLPVGTNPDNQTIVDSDIAFSDDGQTGYIAMIRNNDPMYLNWTDSTLYLTVYKTTDGGLNWGDPCDIDFRTALDSVLAQDTSAEYSAGFDIDVVVDMNGHLHILTGVYPGAGFSIFTDAGLWGMFDIYNDNSGDWHAQLLDKPLTFRGAFGDGSTDNPSLSEDSRQFASRSWDGSKLFFSWFDTDTVTFGSANGNLFPDLHSIGYNVSTGLWTSPMNLTTGTAADGSCTFGNGGYYAIDSAANVFSISAVIMTLSDPVQTGQPTTLSYINGANVNMNTATNSGNPVLLRCMPVGISQNASLPELNVTSNYPNPFNGKTSISVSLTKLSDVTIEVSSVLGQVLSTTKYSNLNSGLHQLTIDASKFASGIYTYKVKAGNDIVTKKMIVQ